MIKMTSHMMKTLWTPVVFFIVLFTALLSTLLVGIRLDTIELPGIRVEGLYIKLNKKLIVETKSIEIARQSNKTNSREELITLLNQLPWLNRLFRTIRIDNIHYDNEDIKLLYQDDIFYIDSKYLTLDATLTNEKTKLLIGISNIHFKDFSLKLQGDVTLDLKKDTAFFEGKFATFNIQGDLALRIEDEMLYYVAQSNTFDNLAPFMEHLESKVTMEKEVGDWVYKKIKASSYQLNSLEGQLNLRNGDFFPYKMKGKAHVKNAVITFHPDVKPALIHSMDIILKNNQLLFDLHKAEYQGIDVTGSHAYIYNLLTKGNGIVLNINASTRLNEKIHPILKAYKINLPITQHSGVTEAKLKIDIRFVPYDLDAKGYFILHDADLQVSNAPMYSKYAEIELNNYLIHLTNTDLQYDGLFDIQGNGTFNTRTGKFHGNIDIDHLHVGFGKDAILEMHNTTTPTIMHITKDELLINLKAFKTKLFFGDGYNKITQTNLAMLYDYSALMQKNKLYDGNVTVNTQDFKTFDIDLHVNDATLPLIKDNHPVTALNLSIQASKDTLTGMTPDKKLKLNVSKGTTSIDLDTYNVIIKDHNGSSSERLHLEASNSNLFLKDLNRTVLTDFYSVTVENDTVDLNASYSSVDLSLHATSNTVEIQAKNLKEEFINTFAAKEFFEGGIFSLSLYGQDFKNFSGNFHIDKSYVKNMRVYNDILSLINTLPALATFKSPDFDEKGYRIESADILFSREKDIVTLHAINIDGVSADITGKGTIDLTKNTLVIDLQLKTLQDVSKVVEKIPLVNYIVLGKDNSISTAVKITGSIDDPKVETQVLQDTVITPFNILKRTIELPFKLFTN